MIKLVGAVIYFQYVSMEGTNNFRTTPMVNINYHSIYAFSSIFALVQILCIFIDWQLTTPLSEVLFPLDNIMQTFQKG